MALDKPVAPARDANGNASIDRCGAGNGTSPMTILELAKANGKAVGAVTLAAGFAFTLFEIFIAALQAYIFTLLTAVYISISQESH